MKVTGLIIFLGALIAVKTQGVAPPDIDLDLLNTLNTFAQNCSCVPPDQCIDDVIDTKGTNRFKYRVAKTCDNPGYICCHHEKPPQPTANPTPPTVNPTPPTVNPTPPTVNPTPPTVNPTPPVVNPTPPTVNPTPPVVNPTPPTVNPTPPTVNPTPPTVNPTPPTVNPTPPTVNPAPPTLNPAPPTVNTRLPTVNPTPPTVNPTPPTVNPTPPTLNPAPPTVNPIIPVTNAPVTLQNVGCGLDSASNDRANLNPVTEADPGSYPWTVSIYKSNKYLSVGSLIHPRAVLAAAHNVRRHKPASLTIRAGEYDRNTEAETMFNFQQAGVAKIVLHDKYNLVLKSNDAAILFLDQDIKLEGYVGFACLPPLNMDVPLLLCTVSGWGTTQVGGQLQERMKTVELPIRDRAWCQESISRIPNINKKYQLPDSMLCAGGEAGTDTCKGDGGAPLVCPYSDGERYFQAGITSWGVGCGEEGRPGYYTSVAKVREWIDRTMTAEGYDASTYTPPAV